MGWEMNGRSKLRLPPLLMAVHVVSVLGIGLSLFESTAKPGRSLGIVPHDMAWPIFGVCAFVDAICIFRIYSLIRQHNRRF